MIWSGLGHTASGKAVPPPAEVAASDIEMETPAGVPAAPGAPPTSVPTAPPGPPPPPGSALAA
eukprot:8050335-Prorocentrum_lima.AAC.1